MNWVLAVFVFLFVPFAFSQSRVALSDREASVIARAAAEEFAQGKVQEMRARFSAEMSTALDLRALEDFRRSLSASAGTFRNVRPSSLLTLLVALAPLSAQTPAPAAIARAAGEELATGKYAELYARFDAQMRQAVMQAQLPALAQQLFGAAGTFEKVDGNPVCEPVQGVQSCVVPLLFEKVRISMRFTVMPAGQLAGLFVAENQPRASNLGTNIEIAAGDVKLPGYLTLPEGPGPHPVIVLVHGSGPNDADETIGRVKPFRDLADGLKARGIGTLRYFKRTSITSNVRLNFDDETVLDALSALKLARESDRVDPQRVFLLGHSLGGYLAPHIATRDPKVRGVIIMAGNNRPMRDSVVDQIVHVTGAQAGFDALWNSLPQYYRDGLPGYDAPRVAGLLGIPILVLQGGRDYQVTMKDYERWQAALASRTNATFHLYPALNHGFIAGEGKSMPTDYQSEAHVPTEVMDDITKWLKAAQ